MTTDGQQLIHKESTRGVIADKKKKKTCSTTLKVCPRKINWQKEKWRNILWTDESKIVLFGGSGSSEYVRRSPNTEYKAQDTQKTVKHDGAKLIIWESFSYNVVGQIHSIRAIMDRYVYVGILQEVKVEWNMPLK